MAGLEDMSFQIVLFQFVCSRTNPDSFFQINKQSSSTHLAIQMFQNMISEINNAQHRFSTQFSTISQISKQVERFCCPF